jgi:multidrug resistance efflux pump
MVWQDRTCAAAATSYLGTVLTVAVLLGQESPSTVPDGYHVQVGQVLLIEEAELSAGEAGRLLELLKEGELVEPDQLVARTDDEDARYMADVEKWSYEAQKKEVESDIRKRYAEAQAKVNQAKYENAKQATERYKRAITDTQLREIKFEWDAAVLGIENTLHEMDIARINVNKELAEWERALAIVNRHHIKSPIRGVVAKTHRHLGEYLRPGDPIARIENLDRLRVQGYINFADKSQAEVFGRPVTIRVHVANDSGGNPVFEDFSSTISFVSTSISANGDYYVWADFDNRDNLIVRPGMSAEMIIR